MLSCAWRLIPQQWSQNPSERKKSNEIEKKRRMKASRLQVILLMDSLSSFTQEKNTSLEKKGIMA